MKGPRNLINGVLCCLNPRFNISCDHYVCGSNLALFTSIAQVEKCLSGFTNSCKCLLSESTKPVKSTLKK